MKDRITSITLGLLLLTTFTTRADSDAPGTTVVYYTEGKKRVHVEDCVRYRRMDAGVKEAMTTMTLAEARAKGLVRCSRCPGSNTPGKGTKGGLESWVNPPPDEVTTSVFEPSERAPLVSIGDGGKLVYQPYSDKGDRVLDWSHCGYRQSEEAIPMVPVRATLEPVPGEVKAVARMRYPMGPDSRERIQDALDKVAAMRPDADGIKGAVLLKKGVHHVHGSLQVRSGVVLRGQGDGDDGTVLVMHNEQGGGNAIELGEPDARVVRADPSNPVRIANSYLPSGSTRLDLEDAGSFEPGDFVHVTKTVNGKWIDDLGMGERLRHIRGGKEGLNKNPWKPKSYQFKHLRAIEKVWRNSITLDVMLPQSIAGEHGGGEVCKVDISRLGTHCGIEGLRIVSNYDTTVEDKGKGSNFLNFKTAVSVSGTSDSWVRYVTVKHFSFAAVALGDHSRQVTVRDCRYLEPVGPKRGGNRYSFVIDDGTLHLVYNCYSEDARHCFAGGSRTMGPNAFVDCTSVRGGQSEPHHRWGTGFLYDHVTTRDGVLAAINRGDSGSGHGWSAANTMIWNGDAKNIVVFDPETEGENNFAIGYRGKPLTDHDTKPLEYANTRAGYWGTPREGRYYGHALMGNGHLEMPDGPARPASLFIQQLIDRIGRDRAAAVLE